MRLTEENIFWRNIDKIKEHLNMNDVDFAKVLQLDLKEYKKINGSKTLLSVGKTFELAEKFNFHFEDLLKTDFKLKDQNFSVALLSRYNFATHSFIKPIMSIMYYLENTRGTRAKLNVLRKFQLTEEFLLDETNKANVHLISDISNYVQKTFLFSDLEFVTIGRTAPFVNSNTFLHSHLTGHATVQDMFSYFIEECTGVFDKNSTYRLDELTSDYAIVTMIPKKEVIDELGINLNEFASVPTGISRGGIISSMTMFEYNMNAPVKKISCIYNGDKCDRYYLDLRPFQKAPPRLKLVQ